VIQNTDWYRKILWNILTHGVETGPRGLKTREMINVSVRLPMAENIVLSEARKPNYRFMAAEFLWMANGRDDLAPLTRVNPHMAKFSDDGARLAGAYGPWFKLGVGRAFALLRRDHDTRQAFVKIGPPQQPDSKDVPCTMTWQFLIRDLEGRGPELHMVANMRSSDAWLGIPYDVYTFSQIGNCVAGALGLPRGFLFLNLASSHIYAEHIEAATAVQNESWGAHGHSPELDGLPPSWTNLVLDTFSTDNAWFPTAAPVRPEFARLCLAYTAKSSADALHIMTDEGGDL
jgi:thymidylate synthase